MSDVTRILTAMEDGDSAAAEAILPLVYRELRQLAAAKLIQEPTGQTLQPTALVHEAYVRLVDVNSPQVWNSRGHFFVAAAEAMRRILVEKARRKQSQKLGGRMAARRSGRGLCRVGRSVGDAVGPRRGVCPDGSPLAGESPARQAPVFRGADDSGSGPGPESVGRNR